MQKKTWLWWSSGKDSAWALHALKNSKEYTIEGLVTTCNAFFKRVSIHGVHREILYQQAKEVQQPLTTISLPFPCHNKDYETAVYQLIDEACEQGIQSMVFGDLCLEEVRDYREKLFKNSGIELVFPLWGRNRQQLAWEMIEGGLKAMIVALNPQKIATQWAGASFDYPFLESLDSSVDPCGENGEFHTLVYDAPFFEHALILKKGQAIEREGIIYCDFSLEKR